MKNFIIVSLTTLFVIASYHTALARPRSDIDDTLDDMIEFAETMGFEVLDSDSDILFNDADYNAVFYTVDFYSGDYIVMGECDQSISNLDIAVWYEDGFDIANEPIAQDIDDDNGPFVSFTLDRYETVVIGIWATEFARRVDEGDFCIMWASEIEVDEQGK